MRSFPPLPLRRRPSRPGRRTGTGRSRPARRAGSTVRRRRAGGRRPPVGGGSGRSRRRGTRPRSTRAPRAGWRRGGGRRGGPGTGLTGGFPTAPAQPVGDRTGGGVVAPREHRAVSPVAVTEAVQPGDAVVVAVV